MSYQQNHDISNSLMLPIITGGLTVATAVAGLAYTWYNHANGEVNEYLKQQTVVIDKEKGIRRNVILQGQPLTKHAPDNLFTLYDCFLNGVKVARNLPCLGWRPSVEAEYKWLSYQETYDVAQSFGSGLLNAEEHNFQNNSYIGIYAVNSPEWLITQQGCIMYNIVVVPLYDTLGDEACCFIMNQTKMPVIVCDTPERAMKVIADLPNRPHVRRIVIISPDGRLDELRKLVKSDIIISSFAEILTLGNPILQHRPPKPSDTFLICYTSGTTGMPKGVMLTHANAIAVRGSVLQIVGPNVFAPNEVYISYLPLAHIFEQVVSTFMLSNGGQIGFYSGDVTRLLSDIQMLKPTLFVTVPRVLSRVYDKVMATVCGSAIKRNLLNYAISSKIAALERGIISKTTIWDYFLFSKIQQSLGGRVRTLLCGSAPLSPDVLRFTKAVFGCKVYEGFGSTETCSGISITLPGEPNGSRVGPPLPCCEVMLGDVPDMLLIAKRDNLGEVLIRGANCTSGYFCEPEKTAELFTKDGWLRTGDIGTWTEDGSLTIVDRCKNIFKLSQGEYVAPEKVEMVYLQSTLIQQIFIDGNSIYSYAVAIVVPEYQALANELNVSLATGKSTNGLTLKELCDLPEAKNLIFLDMKSCAFDKSLKGFEQPRCIFLTNQPFSVENGFLTPTMKLCRSVVRRYYAEKINDMYKEIGMI